MERVKKERGVTLITLIVMIIVVLILAGVGVITSLTLAKKTQESKITAELQMVQHAVFEQYVKFNMTHNTSDLVGKKMEQSEIEQVATELGITLVTIPPNMSYAEYYWLNTQDLEKIGIKETKDEYIVNYRTGEVINITTKQTKQGTILYTKANRSLE